MDQRQPYLVEGDGRRPVLHEHAPARDDPEGARSRDVPQDLLGTRQTDGADVVAELDLVHQLDEGDVVVVALAIKIAVDPYTRHLHVSLVPGRRHGFVFSTGDINNLVY